MAARNPLSSAIRAEFAAMFFNAGRTGANDRWRRLNNRRPPRRRAHFSGATRPATVARPTAP